MPGIFDDDDSGTPGFNILGMLLGGRSYAAQHFALRDQAAQEQFQQKQRQQFATGLLGSDELRRANANPLDREAQFGLWGQFYGQPGGNVQLGNSLLDTSIRSIYGNEASKFDQAQWEKRLNLTTDAELKVDQIKRDRDIAAKKAAMSLLFAPGESGQPGIVEQANRNNAARAAGITIPDGYDAVPGKDGLAFRPSGGTDDFRKMFGEVQANQNIVSGLKNLQDMMANNTGSKGDWDGERAALMMEIKKAEDLGALDKGSLDFMAEVVPEYNANWKTLNPQNFGQSKEKLRVAMERYQAKLAQTLDRWQIPANLVPNRGSQVLAPSTPTKPVPSGPAVIAQPPTDRRTLERWNRLKPQPEPTGPVLAPNSRANPQYRYVPRGAQ